MDLSFGQWLLVKRKAAKLSQSDLAGKLGVSRQTVSNWENGLFVPELTFAQVKAFCTALQCELWDIPTDNGSDR